MVVRISDPKPIERDRVVASKISCGSAVRIVIRVAGILFEYRISMREMGRNDKRLVCIADVGRVPGEHTLQSSQSFRHI